jgi:hypothetical protein
MTSVARRSEALSADVGSVEDLLVYVVECLEVNPELSGRLRRLLGTDTSGTAEVSAAPMMTVAEFAKHTRCSTKTVRNLLKEMTEGEHYHRSGKSGRRYVIHQVKAAAWLMQRGHKDSGVSHSRNAALQEDMERRLRLASRSEEKSR